MFRGKTFSSRVARAERGLAIAALGLFGLPPHATRALGGSRCMGGNYSQVLIVPFCCAIGRKTDEYRAQPGTADRR